MFLYGIVTSTWDIFRYLASNFLLITVLMRSKDPDGSSAGNTHTVYYCGMVLYGIVFLVENRTSIGRLLEEHASRWAARAPAQMRP
ncbi:hypothetical protein BGY98DRAFT_998922 [Russula aff. rugulosa BPL654]|nr:hypothetical protein BGY98DRAFT_998922 [Russula aff. rugulosa BPL654]